VEAIPLWTDPVVSRETRIADLRADALEALREQVPHLNPRPGPRGMLVVADGHELWVDVSGARGRVVAQHRPGLAREHMWDVEDRNELAAALADALAYLTCACQAQRLTTPG
jgi:hypothetical protein